MSAEDSHRFNYKYKYKILLYLKKKAMQLKYSDQILSPLPYLNQDNIVSTLTHTHLHICNINTQGERNYTKCGKNWSRTSTSIKD